MGVCRGVEHLYTGGAPSKEVQKEGVYFEEPRFSSHGQNNMRREKNSEP